MASRLPAVRSPEEYQIRSYHRAFAGELTLHTFGGDLRPWRPIPARGVFWAGVMELVVFVAAHVVGLHLPFLSPSWGFFYLIIPFGFAWLFTVARIEGRRLHVAVTAWMKHLFLGNHLVGGYRRIPGCKSLSPSQKRWIHLSETYEPPNRLPIRRYVIAALPVLLLFITLWIALNSHDKAASRVVSSHALPWPAITMPTIKVANGKLASHHHRTVKHRTAIHPVRRLHPVRHVTRHSVTHVTRSARATVVSHRVVIRSPAFTPIIRPVVAHVSTPIPIRATPYPQQAPCYPGQLGC